MLKRTGVAGVLFFALIGQVHAGGLQGQLHQETAQVADDPLGVDLIRLCHDSVAQPMVEQLRKEVQRIYSPRHLERLLACGNVETRRAAVLAIGLIGDTHSQVATATALRDPDEDVRMRAEQACRQIWVRLGTSEQQVKLARIRDTARNQDMADASVQASSLIRTAPEYAEAWNERAILYFQADRYADAISDCRRALELNPYHFGAASGMAQCHLRLNQIPEAIDAFKLTAKLHPRLPGLSEQIGILEQAVATK